MSPRCIDYLLGYIETGKVSRTAAYRGRAAYDQQRSADDPRTLRELPAWLTRQDRAVRRNAATLVIGVLAVLAVATVGLYWFVAGNAPLGLAVFAAGDLAVSAVCAWLIAR